MSKPKTCLLYGDWMFPAAKLAEVEAPWQATPDGKGRNGAYSLWRDLRGRYYLRGERWNDEWHPAMVGAKHVARVHRLTTTGAILWCIKQTVGSGAGIDLRWAAILALGGVGATGELKPKKKQAPQRRPHGQAA